MTVIHHNPYAGKADGTHVWLCETCHCAHICAGDVLLTFSPDEFAAFTRAVVDCYCEELTTKPVAVTDYLSLV